MDRCPGDALLFSLCGRLGESAPAGEGPLWAQWNIGGAGGRKRGLPKGASGRSRRFFSRPVVWFAAARFAAGLRMGLDWGTCSMRRKVRKNTQYFRKNNPYFRKFYPYFRKNSQYFRFWGFLRRLSKKHSSLFVSCYFSCEFASRFVKRHIRSVSSPSILWMFILAEDLIRTFL